MSALEAAVRAARLGQPEPEGGGLAQAFVFAPDFVGFAGHFPGNPVLPAVVQLLAGRIAAEALLGRPLALRAVTQAKFLQPVGPGEVVRLACRPAAGPSPQMVDCRLTLAADGSPAAAFRLEVEPLEAP
jgi:3-hydroxyacyl-[acyl-carrier-protein] dehydratase